MNGEFRSRRGSFWLYIFVLAAVGGGIYYAWSQDFDVVRIAQKAKEAFTGAAPAGGFSVSKTIQGSPAAAKSFAQKVEETIKGFVSAVTEKPKQAATTVLKDVQKTATESVKTQVAQLVGLPSAGAPSDRAYEVSLVRRPGESLAFRIEAGDKPVEYTIEWGDGTATKGALAKNQSKIIEHAWSKPGDYTVTIDQFSFPVTVVGQ